MTYDPVVLPFRTLSLALVAAVGFLPAMPAEHAHETETDGHVHLVVHQHAQPHTLGHLAGEHHRHDRQETVDHPDDPVLTLSTVFTTSPPQTLAVPVRVVVAIIQPVHLDVARASSGFVERLIHGPPRAPSGLRAPPVSLA
jgi:hypothetical protein